MYPSQLTSLMRDPSHKMSCMFIAKSASATPFLSLLKPVKISSTKRFNGNSVLSFSI